MVLAVAAPLVLSRRSILTTFPCYERGRTHVGQDSAVRLADPLARATLTRTRDETGWPLVFGGYPVSLTTRYLALANQAASVEPTVMMG